MPRSPLYQLTRLEIVNAKPAIKPYMLADGGRLSVLIKLDGAKLWRWNDDFAGNAKTVALGRVARIVREGASSSSCRGPGTAAAGY